MYTFLYLFILLISRIKFFVKHYFILTITAVILLIYIYNNFIFYRSIYNIYYDFKNTNLICLKQINGNRTL